MRSLILLTLLCACRPHVVDDVDWQRPTTSNVMDAKEAQAKPIVDPTQTCASAFGDLLTLGFGRLDGTLVAIVPPDNASCAMPNPDHLVLQIEVQGKVLRVEVNTQADRGPDAGVRMQAVEARHLEGPTFGEGWHTGVSLDYMENFGMSAADLAPQTKIADQLMSWLEVGQAISVYAQSSGAPRAHTAHLVHRTSHGKDGAIVLNPKDDKPIYLIFAFAGQEF